MRGEDPKPLLRIAHERVLLTGRTGAVIVYTNVTLHHQLIHLSATGAYKVAMVHRWTLKGRQFYAAVFREVPPGPAMVKFFYHDMQEPIEVVPGKVTVLDWRVRADIGPGRWSKFDSWHSLRVVPRTEPAETAAAADEGLTAG
jgi:hypothetical protein